MREDRRLPALKTGALFPVSLGLVAALTAACSSPSRRADGPDAAAVLPGSDAGVADAAVPAPDLAAADAAADAAVTRDAGGVEVPRTGRALPAGVAPARRMLDPRARLTGGGTNSCSHQEPPSGDGHRWCAFTLPGASKDLLELWVIDVSRAAAGPLPRCDGSAPGCLRLTPTLWTAFSLYGPAHPYAHAFDGDTLIFYVGTPARSDAVYRGQVHAWRPGWPASRPITADKGLLCYGHRRTAVAFCISDVVGDPAHPDSFEVLAGSVAEPSGGPLPLVGRINPFRSSGGDALWGWSFSGDGQLLAVASPDPDPTVASIRVVATRDVGKVAPVEVVRDAATWSISHDAKKVYFSREDAAAGTRSLHMADFPSGANPIKLGERLDDYLALGDGDVDRGVAFLQKLDADHYTFQLLRDRDKPSESIAVFSALRMIEGVSVSDDLRYTAWVSAMFQSRVVRHTDQVSCLLNTTTRRPAYWPRFLPGSRLVFWEEDGLDDPGRRDGFHGVPEGCQERTRFAQGLDFYHLIGDRGIVYGDELDAQYRVTLKYAPIAGGKDWPADGPVRIHEHVKTDKGAIVVGTNPTLLVFEVASGVEAEDGLFVFGPTPF